MGEIKTGPGDDLVSTMEELQKVVSDALRKEVQAGIEQADAVLILKDDQATSTTDGSTPKPTE